MTRSFTLSLFSLIFVLAFLFRPVPLCAQANSALSNLVAPTAVNVDLLPGADNARSFGSLTKGWKQLYVNSTIFMGGSKFISFGSSISLRDAAFGYNALNLITTGGFNTAIGATSMQNTTTGFGNVALGYSSLYGNTTGYSNIAIGIRSLNANTSGHNLIAIGDSALLNQNGGSGFNIAIGAKALYSNTTGDHNTAIGSASFYNNKTGRNNVGIGSSALYNNTNGAENNAVGHGTLLLNTTGSSNVGIGAFALNNNSSGFSNIAIGSRAMNNNKTGSRSVAIGDSAMYNVTGSPRSVAVGSKSLFSAQDANENVAVGYEALYSNVFGSDNTAVGYRAMTQTNAFYNTAIGAYALYTNADGYANTAVGLEALSGNTSGFENTATGRDALHLNISGARNVATGLAALGTNRVGNANVAIGASALYFFKLNNTVAVGDSALAGLITGLRNTAVGSKSLWQNNGGSGNTEVGFQTAYSNTGFGDNNTGLGAYAHYLNSGGANVAVGYSAGYYASTNCTYVGTNVYGSVSAITNSTGIGYLTSVTASNIVRIGNGSITSIGGQVGWSTLSDARFKKNVKANVPGLEFIKTLRPVTYTYDPVAFRNFVSASNKAPDGVTQSSDELTAQKTADAEKAKIVYTGFVAQEVEEAAKKANFDFSGVDAPKNDRDYYSLRLADFVAPMVMAMQQLSDKNDSLEAKLGKMDSLEARLQRLESLLANGGTTGASLSDAQLGQNQPNPVGGSTIISYILPASFGRAKLLITDMAGRVLKTIPVYGSGRGNINLDASGLSSGVYNYSFYVDEKIIGTRQMVKK